MTEIMYLEKIALLCLGCYVSSSMEENYSMRTRKTYKFNDVFSGSSQQVVFILSNQRKKSKRVSRLLPPLNISPLFLKPSLKHKPLIHISYHP